MQTTEKITELLANISEQQGNDEAIDREGIIKELAADAAAYQGLAITLLSIVGGILGTLFLLGFVALAIANSAGATFIAGIVLIGGAVWLNKTSARTIVDTASVTAFLAGFGMALYGMLQLNMDDQLINIILMVLCLATITITSGMLLNFFSVLIFYVATFSLIYIWHAYQMIHVLTAVTAIGYTYLCLFEPELIAGKPEVARRYMAIRNGVLFSFVALMGYFISWRLHSSQLDNEYVSAIVIVVIAGFLLHYIINVMGINTTRGRFTAYLVGAMVLLPGVLAPAIAGALLIIILSHHTGHRLGLLVGIAGLLYAIGQYYYDLRLTLLVKSEIMMASGAVFLAAWFILKNQLKRYEQN